MSSLGWAMQIREKGASSSWSGLKHPPLLPRSPPPESWRLHVKSVGARALEGAASGAAGVNLWLGCLGSCVSLSNAWEERLSVAGHLSSQEESQDFLQ